MTPWALTARPAVLITGEGAPLVLGRRGELRAGPLLPAREQSTQADSAGVRRIRSLVGGRPWMAVMLVLLGACTETPNAQYRRGEVRPAAEAYARAVERGDTSRIARYNLGTALLRLRRFGEARPQLEGAVSGSGRMLGERAHYNIGNTELEPAFTDTSRSEERAAALRRAASQYKRALLLDPADRDAKWNLELAQRLLGEPPPRNGGGGGGGEDNSGGGDDQNQGDPQPAPAPPQPTRSSAGAGDPNLSRGEAESILSAAERDERELQRRKLRQAPPGERAARDW